MLRGIGLRYPILFVAFAHRICSINMEFRFSAAAAAAGFYQPAGPLIRPSESSSPPPSTQPQAPPTATVQPTVVSSASEGPSKKSSAPVKPNAAQPQQQQPQQPQQTAQPTQLPQPQQYPYVATSAGYPYPYGIPPGHTYLPDGTVAATAPSGVPPPPFGASIPAAYPPPPPPPPNPQGTICNSWAKCYDFSLKGLCEGNKKDRCTTHKNNGLQGCGSSIQFPVLHPNLQLCIESV